MGGRGRDFFFFLSLPLRSYHRSCRPQDRDSISLSPRTRVMPRRNDSALSCIRSNHSLFDVGVTSLYAVVLDPGVCYSNHGAALFLTSYSGDFSFPSRESLRIAEYIFVTEIYIFLHQVFVKFAFLVILHAVIIFLIFNLFNRFRRDYKYLLKENIK